MHFATVPIYPWLRDDIASVKDILVLKRRLMESLSKEGPKDCQDKVIWVKRDVVSSVLRCEDDQTNVLLDLMMDVSDVGNACVCKDAAGECVYVDVHRLLLCLCVHLYLKTRVVKSVNSDNVRCTGDVWPGQYCLGGVGSHHQVEPSSPLKLHQRSFGGSKEGCDVRKGGESSDDCLDNGLATRRLGGFLVLNLDTFIDIIVDDVDSKKRESLFDHEIDRFGFLLDCPDNAQGMDAACERWGRREGAPFSSILQDIIFNLGFHSVGDGLFSVESVSAALNEVLQTWLCRGGKAMEEDGLAPMNLGPSYPINVENAVSRTRSRTGIIHGVHRVSVIRGMDECQYINSLRVVSCHDSVIYVIAPLKWVRIVSCTNSIIVLGAVGQCLRVEQCERLQVVSVSSHIVVNTCHDCILYTATNRPPLIVGDNRFVQLAPYNSGYQCLEEHMKMCGIVSGVNAWNMPMMLMPDKPVFRQQPHELQEQHQLDHSMNVTLLPPEKIMPFVIPFRGSTGPLCGGPAPPLTKGGVGNDTLTGLLTQDFIDFAPCPFQLPQAYLDAWKARMSGVKSVKEAYKNSKLTDAQKQEFTSTVQSYFKEWLQSGGGMREVYDLAKVEKRKKNYSSNERMMH